MAKGVRGIILSPDEGHILLIKRVRKGKLYYIFPGGGIEAYEDEKSALRREALEETSLHLDKVGAVPMYVSRSRSGRFGEQTYYLCRASYDLPRLSTMSDEFKANSEDNSYQPVWVELMQIKEINLYPRAIKRRLLSDLASGVKQTVVISEP